MDWYEEEVLSNNERWNEYILTRLRTTIGINLKELAQQFTIDQPFERMKEKFKEQNWLLEKDNQLLLTFVGQLKADYIASEFFRV